ARPLPAAANAALLEQLRGEPHGRREMNFTALGGAYDRVAPDGTAFVHRNERFLLEHVSDGDAPWVTRSWAIAHAHGSGRVYPNFPDPRLRDWADAYHGDNLARLVAAKHAYDPDGFFRFPQAIPPRWEQDIGRARSSAPIPPRSTESSPDATPKETPR
ncbi:MAG TPA: BBE domain-containing protein, partial [Mycobacterium sp.]|nr:BBE domain-containing protein [Mycobacterium sp.]